MSPKWLTRTLGEACLLRGGAAFSKDLQGRAWGDLPFIKVSDFELPQNSYRIVSANNWISFEDARGIGLRPHTAGATVFAKIGVALLSNRRRLLVQDTAIDNNLMSATPRADISARFLFYLLRTLDFGIQAGGSALPYLTATDLNAIQVQIPPADDQRAIAAVLGALDDKIEQNRGTARALERLARAIFRAWFVDFEPVKAKAEGRTSFPSMPQDVFDTLPTRFVDSEIGPVPEGWEVKAIGDFIDRLQVGQKYEQKTVSPIGKVPVLDQGKSGVIGYHDDVPGVVASVDAPVVVFANHTCYMRLIHFPFSAIQNVLPFIGQGVDTIWAFYATYGKQSFIEYKGHWPDFVVHKIVVPDAKLTAEFSRLIHSLLKMIWVQESESRKLAEICDYLLPRLLNGSVRVGAEVETMAIPEVGCSG